jgi:hypothetical protein
MIGRSDFFWIGNYFRDLRGPRGRATQKWWNTLRRNIARKSKRVPSSGSLTSKPADIHAFPHALKKIQAGTQRAENPT